MSFTLEIEPGGREHMCYLLCMLSLTLPTVRVERPEASFQPPLSTVAKNSAPRPGCPGVTKKIHSVSPQAKLSAGSRETGKSPGCVRKVRLATVRLRHPRGWKRELNQAKMLMSL